VKIFSHFVRWQVNQVNDIRAGGTRILARKAKHAPITLFNGFWAVPAVLVIRAIRPLILSRFGSLNSSRIGHFISDGAEQFARVQLNSSRSIDWFWLGETCNSQWERMIRRTLSVHLWVRYLDWWNRALPGGSLHERPSSYTNSRDVEGLHARCDVKIPFLQEEREEALSWLRSKGWEDGQPFVCLLVRDAEFLRNDPMYGDARQRAALDWSYHNYRDSNITTFLTAIEWLSSRGVWIIRMGRLMEKPLPQGMSRVID